MCNPAAKGWRHSRRAAAAADAPWGGKGSAALRRMTYPILVGYVLNTCAYLLLARGPFLPPSLASSSRYCPTTTTTTTTTAITTTTTTTITTTTWEGDEEEGDDGATTTPTTTTTIPCERRDLLAFQVVSLLNLSFLGLFGVRSFFLASSSDDDRRRRTARTISSLPRTSAGRTLSLPMPRDAMTINAAIVVFQGWDLVMSSIFAEYRDAVMLAHHLLAFTCGYFCLVYEVLPYYAVYFGGVCEFSSIFLCISDFFQVHPPSSIAPPSTSLYWMLATVETLSQATFVVTFFAFRIVGWAFMLYMFISDGSYLIRSGLLKTHRPGSGWFLWYEMTLGVLLGALQLYWLKVILEKVSKILE